MPGCRAREDGKRSVLKAYVSNAARSATQQMGVIGQPA
jgi:hypothetical protein